MHKFLRSIGFRNLWSIHDEEFLVADVLKYYDYKKVVEDELGQKYAQISREYMSGCGVTVCGYYDEDRLFHMSHYYPFMTGTQSISCPQIHLEKQANGLAYIGACDDVRVGTTLIYYLLNADNYINAKQADMLPRDGASLCLSGLAEEARILLPLVKKEPSKPMDAKDLQERMSLYNRAADGNEEAIENLTMEDIDAYTMIARRIRNEDIYTIVDTYFMPFGLECDMYNVMGDIVGCRMEENQITDERIWILTIVTNGIPLDICVNDEDVTGEPQVGRRFKGIVWLQGMLLF